MESINFQFDKAKSSLKFHKPGKVKITDLCRFIELCMFIVIVVSKLSVRFNIDFHPFYTHAEFLQKFITPPFVFLFGNAIVFVLLLRSGQFSNCEVNHISEIEANLYSNCENYSICEEETKPITKSRSESEIHNPTRRRKMQRSKSEKSKRADCGGQKLKRSATEKCLQRGENSYYSADELSNEEFRRTVEDFIARRQRCLMEDELSIGECELVETTASIKAAEPRVRYIL